MKDEIQEATLGLQEARLGLRDLLKNKADISRLKNMNFSVISSDCTGGLMLRDLHMEFNSPTINLYFNASDFIKFCSNLDGYLNGKISSIINCIYDYPVAMLNGVGGEPLKLFLVHYHSVSEAAEAWERRKNRVNFENIFIIMNDRNGCTEENIAAFDNLPFDNKVIFTHLPYPKYKSSFYIHGSENQQCLKPLMDFLQGELSYLRYYDEFDYVHFFNTGELKYMKEIS